MLISHNPWQQLFTLLLAVLAGLITHSPNLHAQVAITAVPFLEINNDARSMGMAGANVAMRGARSGVHLNPAAFGKPNTLELTSQLNLNGNGDIFGTPWLPGFSGLNRDIYTPQLIGGFEKFSVAYQYTRFDLGEQARIGPDSPEPIDTFQSYERVHTLSAAFYLSPHVSVGAGVNHIKSSLATGISIGNGNEIRDGKSISWDLGVYADYPFRQDFVHITPSFGWSITDIGRPIKYIPNSEGDPIHMVMRAGVGLDIAFTEKKYGLEILSIGGYISRDKIMARVERHITQSGDTTRKAMGPIEAIFNSWDPYTQFTGNETVTVPLKDQLRRQSGLEITLLEYISLRFGRYWEHQHNGNSKYNTYGFGINLKYLSIDYAKINTDELYHPLDQTTYFQFTTKIPFDDIEQWFD